MKYFLKIAVLINFSLLIISCLSAQTSKQKLTHQDTLRGSIGKGREWWNVVNYKINATPDYNTKTILGVNRIRYKVVKQVNNTVMQIDLQEPMQIDKIWLNSRITEGTLKPIQITDFKKEGNAWFIKLPGIQKVSQENSLEISFSGKPREAVNPPWDGGWIWKKDANGNPWMSVACQGLGASVWYPCKDHQSDEPDLGASLSITVPDTLSAIGNGRLKEKKSNNDGTSTWIWEVKNPINNYNIIPYIGKYTNWNDTYDGENGKLDCSYWVLDNDLEKAKKQFTRDVHPMLKAFEYWFGPYPFYEDGYKLVESPHLGMEHQSATAYGNKFLNGYLGRDLSGSGWGLKWDFIIVHESGHEWFGNNITTNELADMWIHEGFTAYSETLFTEYQYGKEAGSDYITGTRKSIKNDKPVIGIYGVNKSGSGDMYPKGANLLHTIRQVIDDDTLFRQILRGLNKTFYHQTVTSKQVENYISKTSKKDLSKIFDQYLRTIQVPELEYKIAGDKISYRWINCIKGFNMPVRLDDTGKTWLYPTTKWKTVTATGQLLDDGIKPDRNFYINLKRL